MVGGAIFLKIGTALVVGYGGLIGRLGRLAGGARRLHGGAGHEYETDKNKPQPSEY
jgi:hypothetical protein